MTSSGATLISQVEAQVYTLAVRFVSLAESMRLVPKGAVSDESVRVAMEAFAREGVARHAASSRAFHNARELTEMLVEALAAVEESPLPQHQWVPIMETLGPDVLEGLLGVSTSSIHRYRNGTRPTPDRVAARLHVVTLIVTDLAGSYNEFGIRRWFGRSRAALKGHSPAEILSGDWGPDEEATRQVRALAATLLGPMAA